MSGRDSNGESVPVRLPWWFSSTVIGGLVTIAIAVLSLAFWLGALSERVHNVADDVATLKRAAWQTGR